MQTADWALVISLFSFVIALAGFIWNVWSKFIYPKPTLRVSFGMRTNMQLGGDGEDAFDFLELSATNMGPIETTIGSAVVLYRPRWFSPKSYATLITLRHTDPERSEDLYLAFSSEEAGRLPKKLAVGEGFSAFLPPDHETLALGDYERIGFADAFHRYHWAPRRDVLEALPKIREACEKSGKNWRAQKSDRSPDVILPWPLRDGKLLDDERIAQAKELARAEQDKLK